MVKDTEGLKMIKGLLLGALASCAFFAPAAAAIVRITGSGVDDQTASIYDTDLAPTSSRYQRVAL